MSRDERINRIAHRALELTAGPADEPESARIAKLRWMARDDHQLLDDAMEAALAAEGDLQRRQAAIQLLARARYTDSQDAEPEA